MLLPAGRPHTRSFVAYGIVALVLILGALASAYVYIAVDRAGRAHILDRANTIAEAIPTEHFSALTGTEEDLMHPSYAKIKSLLSSIQSVNADVRFIYLLGRNTQGELFFYLDSEDPLSEDYSPPGQIYDEATPAMYAFFDNGESIAEGPDRDRWGVWISGYAPIRGEGGEVVALLGIDLPAEQFLADTLIYASLPFLIALLIAVILLAAERVRLQQRDALEEREEFLSVASHEIRTPLTGIRWAIESILKDNAPLPPRAQTLLPLMHENAVTLITRINTLLDVSALQRRGDAVLQPETVDINSLFEDIFSNLHLAAKERGIMFVGPDAGSATLSVDRQIIHQAFFNLVANAVKYTKEGTQVRVSYAEVSKGHELRITDEGEGIPKEEQDRIFEGYHRTRGARTSTVTGTGLGLYLTRRAVELHGGSIRVESEMGKGTTFIVTLPR